MRSTRPIHVAMLSQARLFREAVSSRLAGEHDMAMVTAGGTVYELLRGAGGRPIDVLLVQLRSRPAMAQPIIFDVKALLPASRLVLLLARGPDHTDVVRWIEAGATACLKHDASYALLLDAIRAASQGRTFVDPQVLPDVIRRIAQLNHGHAGSAAFDHEPLSERQRETLQWLDLGLTDKQIAREMGIKPATAKSHVREALRKLRRGRRRETDLGRGRDMEDR